MKNNYESLEKALLGADNDTLEALKKHYNAWVNPDFDRLITTRGHDRIQFCQPMIIPLGGVYAFLRRANDVTKAKMGKDVMYEMAKDPHTAYVIADVLGVPNPDTLANPFE